MAVFAVDPGVADTGTHRDYPWPAAVKAVVVLTKPLLRWLLRTEKAAFSSIHAASAPQLQSRSGLLGDRKGRPIQPPELARRHDVASIVDRVSRELAGLGAPPAAGPHDSQT